MRQVAHEHDLDDIAPDFGIAFKWGFAMGLGWTIASLILLLPLALIFTAALS